MPEFAISGGPLKLNLAANTSSSLVIRFYSKEIPLIERFPIWVDQMGGKPVEGKTEWIDYVEIRHAGENLNVIDRPATDTDRKQYAEQYQRYVDGKEQKPDGIPLNLLFPASPGIVKALEAQSIYTIQQLANLSGHGIESIGMGVRHQIN